MRLGKTDNIVRGLDTDSTDGGSSDPNYNGFKPDAASELSRTRRLGRDARRAAADTMTRAIRAADEITVETTDFVRDAVVGVFEGTGEVVRASRSVVRDVVSAAVRRSTETGASVPDVTKRAVEGAMLGAKSVGVNSGNAGTQASAGVAEAVQRMGGDFREVVGPAIHGVVTGVIATTGNMLVTTRNTSYMLMMKGRESGEDEAVIARLIVDEAINATRRHRGRLDRCIGRRGPGLREGRL